MSGGAVSVVKVRSIPRPLVVVALVMVACARTSAGLSLPAAGPLDFTDDVEPILSEHCFACHGPDPGARKGGLRLDRREQVLMQRDKGAVVVPGRPDDSLLVVRVEANDPGLVMPPPSAHASLNVAERSVLRRWVKEGAPYKEHWSFLAPARARAPKTDDATWARSPIDGFVLERLEREGLRPSPEASREQLIRRVTLDLTGLLPTPAEVDAFITDQAPDAYDKVVTRLLQSPRYGEHRAHYWLDYVRYADTHGVHYDNHRAIWPYRDYVIGAFSQNMPFDRFVVEQVAGDLLHARDLAPTIASAYLRLYPATNEGGTITEENAVNNVRETVENFSAVFLGLTMGCSVCHDHKFDPLSQKDFYSLAAFFNNPTGKPHTDDLDAPPPAIRLPPSRNRAAYDAIWTRRAALQQVLDQRRRLAPELIQAWMGQGGRPRPVSVEGLAARFRFDEGGGVSVANSAPGATLQRAVIGGLAPIWGEKTWLWPSIRFETPSRLALPNVGDFEAFQPFSAGGWFMRRTQAYEAGMPQVGAYLSRLRASRAYRGWELFGREDQLEVRLVSRWPDRALAVKAAGSVPRGEWRHLFVTYDGSGRARGIRIYIDGKPQRTIVLRDSLAGSIRTDAPLQFARRTDRDPMPELGFQDTRVYARALTADEVARLPFEDYAAEIAATPPASWNRDQTRVLTEFFLRHVDGPWKAADAAVAALDQQLAELSRGGEPTVIFEEGPAGLEYAHLLKRGAYNARGERVSPDVPRILPPLPSVAWPDRRALADWLVSPKNPLLARVSVNRMWQELFGVGIVETSEDFGVVGAAPSHRKLLDWLAVEFRDSGWDVKHMYRLLVSSATYRQSAVTSPELREKDPRNRLLARGPRFRMDAEMIRDVALQTSGLLVEKIGGPSVKPYQPPGVWDGAYPESNTRIYRQDHGDNLHRRSLYTYWKRMAPPPSLESFNAPSRERTCTRRERGNTPLQPLVTMNDAQFLEASRRLAELALVEAIGRDDRLQRLSQRVLGRALRVPEWQILLGDLATYCEHYRRHPSDARKLLAVGEAPSRVPGPRWEMAAWMIVASELYNLDESLNK